MSHVSFSWQNDNYDSVAAVVIALIREGKQWVACLLIISIVGDTCSLSCGLESGSPPSEAKICLVAKQSEDKTCKDYRQLFFFLEEKSIRRPSWRFSWDTIVEWPLVILAHVIKHNTERVAMETRSSSDS